MPRTSAQSAIAAPLSLLPPGMTAAEGALELVPIPAAVVALDQHGPWIEASNQTYRVAGLGIEPARSRMIAEIGDRITAFLLGDAPRDSFPWLTGTSVEMRHYRVTIARIAHRLDRACLVTLIDQTGEARTEQSLRREMTTDSLTGLPNRAGFGDRVEAMLGGENGGGGARFAVLILDLVRFSRVNACLGSLAGDELLITVARRIKGALRVRDMLARTGGDEFGILLAIDEDPQEAHQVARRIRGALATPFRLSDYEIRIECSVGIAQSHPGNSGDPGNSGGADACGMDADEIIRHAQFAMKRAKQSGRDEDYQTQAFTRARAAFAMETALRRALDARALTLHFQPICDLSTGRIHAFEALARWTGEDGRAISPVDFIAVAEETGLIVPLGRWAIDEAARTLAAWDARAGGTCGVQVAVNLSAIQLQRDDIPPLIEAALATHGLAGDRLKLELTESALVSDPERIARTLHALRALGTTLAMDDFGTGYSNLATLQKLPIDILKIDRSFVTDMLHDTDKVAIVRAVLSLANALGMQTIAEGVESHAVGQALGALGCTYGQGYAYSPGVPADAAYALIGQYNG